MRLIDMASSRALHRNDKLWGAVAEALIGAYALLSANGKLTSYRPFTDVDGKDLIIDLAGGFNDIYIQVKCALGLNRYQRIGGTVRLHRDRIPSNKKLVYVFCLLDRTDMDLSRIWVVPAPIFYRRAYRTLLGKGMIQFNFDCQSAGDDRWEEFEVDRRGLGPRLVKLIKATNHRQSTGLTEPPAGRWMRLAA